LDLKLRGQCRILHNEVVLWRSNCESIRRAQVVPAVWCLDQVAYVVGRHVNEQGGLVQVVSRIGQRYSCEVCNASEDAADSEMERIESLRCLRTTRVSRGLNHLNRVSSHLRFGRGSYICGLSTDAGEEGRQGCCRVTCSFHAHDVRVRIGAE